jgi:predicted amidohydrolase YtcJ
LHATSDGAVRQALDAIERMRGMAADFIVLDRDLFFVPVDEIHATQVSETWFGGRLVHDATAGAAAH